MAPKKIRVLVADDHPVVRKGLVEMLNSDARLEVAGEATNGLEAVERYKSSRPDVVIIDLSMPEMDGIQAIEAIRAFDAKAKVIIMTAADGDDDIYRALRAGAKSYLLKDATDEEVIKATLLTMDGQRYLAQGVGAKLADHLNFIQLSERELAILKFMADGLSNKGVGRMAGITEGTVKFHVNNILTKLQCASRTEAVALGLKRGLIKLD
ncbi:response regulator transcription factor [Ramlibacter sp. WS9]|uniref:response regulator n=1 Tax=Ramlibacter sp. WS9 TaxID=1882741 RepID=UPI001142484E|nr:response regulator transcription factor [Ramlibacter sp. WS9]ROZ79415.1 DNA-binding response regulator [Ramlibacter sp. WS9]